MFNFVKNTLQKIYSQISGTLATLFRTDTLDENTLKKLEVLLIEADTGVATTRALIDKLKQSWRTGTLQNGNDLARALEHELITLLNTPPAPITANIYLLVGINGSGKTTTAGKLALQKKQEGKSVLLVAADTFRAAATAQLHQWAERSNTPIVIGKEGQDPASVVFAGCESFKQHGYDILIIDTAGRLQTKINLMKELEKIKRTLNKQLPGTTICTLLTIDAMLGQNSFEQAQLFHESTTVNGIVLTKMDGTGKGGIVFAITHKLNIPIMYIACGEKVEDLTLFNSAEYVKGLLS